MICHPSVLSVHLQPFLEYRTRMYRDVFGAPPSSLWSVQSSTSTSTYSNTSLCAPNVEVAGDADTEKGAVAGAVSCTAQPQQQIEMIDWRVPKEVFQSDQCLNNESCSTFQGTLRFSISLSMDVEVGRRSFRLKQLCRSGQYSVHVDRIADGANRKTGWRSFRRLD